MRGAIPLTGLPDVYTSRPLSVEDVERATAVVAACESHDDGEVEIAVSDLESDWARPGLDLATMSVGVWLRDQLVAGGDVYQGRAEVDVHPTHRGRGIGTAFMRWTWDVARADGRAEIGQTVSDHRVDAATLFSAHGYRERWTSWILRIDLGEEPPEASPLPDGMAIRDYLPGDDDRAVFDIVETAFGEWPDRESGVPFEDWRAASLQRREANPSMMPVLVDRDRIIGCALNLDYGSANEGWIQQLAVEKAYRGRGLGRALLTESFRRFHAAGRRECGLSTDSRTGALPLYEHVGMHVRRSYTRWSKQLESTP